MVLRYALFGILVVTTFVALSASTLAGGSLGLPVGDEHLIGPLLLFDDRSLLIA